MHNRLSAEPSPYLRQHADNPVHWWPWCDEALALARTEDKPILLSIGYSACHWCHVMAHESFEDPATAEVMNRLFVNIKVDREERPDLDQIYQNAHQMLAQRAGGWPLTMFLSPDGVPFYSGTYFPREGRYGLPGFVDLLTRIDAAWRTQRAEIVAQNAAVIDALARTGEVGRSDTAQFTDAPIHAAVDGLAQRFDARYGGFGEAPKFPHPPDLALLMQRYRAGGNPRAGEMLRRTLQCMAAGGLYDQIGGGFCRYSVDARWEIPHFEKMLYDNGPLLALYAEAAVVWDDARFRQVAEETAAWALREMRSPEGAFWSALDADSEGEEGRFYVWTPDAVEAAVGAHDAALARAAWGLDQPPNFEGKDWHLTLREPVERVAEKLGMDPAAAHTALARARARLFEVRATRVRPGLDDKVLTSWNGLMIQGLLRAGRVLDRPDWVDAALAAIDTLRDTVWRDGRLFASLSGGQARLNGYLDDYAFLLAALIEALQTRWRDADLAFARALADALIARFGDAGGGGFYFTSHDHEALVHRPRSGHDNATPSGNGIAARSLQQLGHMLGEPRYLDAATGVLQAFHGGMVQAPMGFASLHLCLAEWLAPPRIVVLRGPQAEVDDWARKAAPLADPSTLILPLGEQRVPAGGALDKPLAATVNAWVCSGVKCLSPITDWSALAQELGG
ncbi:MAG: thioredoxin domain-containing protein [Rhodocyclaceae bacterium]|nr:thioredoxin domain-containing protein [Rhodocyclaceae bacterium]MCB1962485.1 thioredoxin domain-containing protein [Rhodocyclaceae bacterium]